LKDEVKMADGDNGGVPAGFAPDGIMAGVPDINATAAQSTLPAVMTPDQINDVYGIDDAPMSLPENTVLLAAQNAGSDQAGGTAPAAGAGVSSATPPAGVDWHFIAGHESTAADGYVPPGSDGKSPDPGSGATIATGFDLSQHNAADLRGLGLPEDFIKQALPLLAQGGDGQTLKGQAAQDYLNAHPLTITPDQAQQIDTAVANHEYNQVAGNYNADQTTGTPFEDLPREAQTAIMSVAHQYDGNLASATPNFWNQVTAGQWQAAHDNLMDFGDDYKTRRRNEAGLLMNAINSGNLPKAPGKAN
jgi:hypothetical protein